MIAPDGRRAGLVWQAGGERSFTTLEQGGPRRWGVFGVGTEHPPTSEDEAVKFLEEIAGRLREEWERSAERS